MTRYKISVDRSNDDVETVAGFCYLVNVLKARGGSEMTVVARARIGVELLRTKRAIIRGVICGVNLIDRKNTEESMQMLSITVPHERVVRAACGDDMETLRREKVTS